MSVLLEVKNLSTHFFTRAGIVPAVNDVSFTLGPGQVLGLVGESGSGKSMTAKAIARLLPDGAETIGSVTFDGVAGTQVVVASETSLTVKAPARVSAASVDVVSGPAPSTINRRDSATSPRRTRRSPSSRRATSETPTNPGLATAAPVRRARDRPIARGAARLQRLVRLGDAVSGVRDPDAKKTKPEQLEAQKAAAKTKRAELQTKFDDAKKALLAALEK